MQLIFKTGQFEDAAKVRKAVFMDEQGFQVEFEDADQDPRMQHITAYNEEGQLVGCARVFPSEMESGVDTAPGRWVFGRLAVFPELRKGGMGAQILAESERVAQELGATEIHLHSQYDKKGFYERFGYEAYGPVELDEHVEHQWMKKIL